jgi:hypothetical protein
MHSRKSIIVEYVGLAAIMSFSLCGSRRTSRALSGYAYMNLMDRAGRKME